MTQDLFAVGLETDREEKADRLMKEGTDRLTKEGVDTHKETETDIKMHRQTDAQRNICTERQMQRKMHKPTDKLLKDIQRDRR